MSLVGNVCKCSDGLWYSEPVWSGPGWFLVLDEDDPPELVVRQGFDMPDLSWFEDAGQANKTSHRRFGRKLYRARSYFGKLLHRPPPPQKFGRGPTAEISKRDWQSVRYDAGKK